MSLYSQFRNCWRYLPPTVRKSAENVRLISAPKEAIKKVLILTASKEEIYDESYYLAVDETASQSAPAMARSIQEMFKPRVVLDVGCGTGALISHLRRLGTKEIGLEYSDAALAVCASRNLNVSKFNIADDDPPSVRPDLVVSFEVAEHLHKEIAGRYVKLLTAYRVPIIMSAAQPGQGGTDHVNEQPPAYWIELLGRSGFTFDRRQTEALANSWRNSQIESWYYCNVMCFSAA